MKRLSYLAPLAALLLACGGSTVDVGSNEGNVDGGGHGGSSTNPQGGATAQGGSSAQGGSGAVCDPLPCPSGQAWNQATCSCGGTTCQPLPCPSGAAWNQATCSCGGGAAGAGGSTSVSSCGGLADIACPAGQFCDYGPTCGAPDTSGTCKALPSTCDDSCSVDPTTGQPAVCGCDGQRYCSLCEANAHGVSVTTCPTTGGGGAGGGGQQTCGFVAEVLCPQGQHCQYTVDDATICGESNSGGVCVSNQEACDDIGCAGDPSSYPWCDCNGNHYCQACEAEQQGISVFPCGGTTTGKSCGGFTAPGTDGGCAADEFCDWAPEAACGATDAPGTCKPKPTICNGPVCDPPPPGGHLPYCGCDGKEYCTACEANEVGVSVHPCDGTTTTVSCGGDTPNGEIACASDQFCDYPTAECGFADGAGTCKAKPTSCEGPVCDPPPPGGHLPFCGCDGKEYCTECEANAAGVSVHACGEAQPGG